MSSSFILIGYMITVTVIAIALRMHLRRNSFAAHPPSSIKNDLEAIAWVTGGPVRALELWFADLSQGGGLSCEATGIITKNCHFPLDKIHAKKSQAAHVELPEVTHRRKISMHWRQIVNVLRKDLEYRGILLMPSRERITLYRLLMVALFALHFFFLWRLNASFIFWIVAVLFWAMGSSFLLLNNLRSVVAPVVIQEAKEIKNENSSKVLAPQEKEDALWAVALGGSAALLGTPFDKHCLPSIGKGVDFSSGCSSFLTGSGCGSGDAGGCGD